MLCLIRSKLSSRHCQQCELHCNLRTRSSHFIQQVSSCRRPVLYNAIEEFCKEVVSGDEHTTILNFLLGVGEHVQFAYSWPGARPGSTCWNGLCYTVRKPPFKSAALADMDYAVDFGKLTTDNDCVAVIATAPLTHDEVWVEFKRGELVAFDEGLPHASVNVGLVEEKGHGLESRVLEKLPLPRAAADFYQWYGCSSDGDNQNNEEALDAA